MMIMSWNPFRDRWERTEWIIGLGPSGSIDLGRVKVRGRRRVPSPPARTTAFKVHASSRSIIPASGLHKGVRPVTYKCLEGVVSEGSDH
jgi:hypothetical protein